MANRVHRGLDQGIAAHGQNHGVRAAPFRRGFDALDHVLSARVDWLMQPKLRRNGVALGIKVGGEHARAGAPRESGEHEADGALPDHQHRLIRGQIEQLHALQGRVQRLDEGCLLERHAVGNPHHTAMGDDPVHHANVLRKAAAGRLKTRRRADFLVDQALRKGLLAAVVALSAGDVVVDHHPLAQRKLRDGLAHFHDGSRHLVAEDARRGVRAGMNLFQVRPADAAGGDLDQQLARPDGGHRDGLHAQVVHAAIDHGLHGGGNHVFCPVFSL